MPGKSKNNNTTDDSNINKNDETMRATAIKYTTNINCNHCERVINKLNNKRYEK